MESPRDPMQLGWKETLELKHALQAAYIKEVERLARLDRQARCKPKRRKH